MIKIVYEPEEFRVTVQGHALFAPAGADVVCAGVSALSDAMFGRVQGRAVWNPAYGMNREKGVLIVHLSPRSRHAAVTAREMLETVCEGYAAIAEKYPDNVKYEVK